MYGIYECVRFKRNETCTDLKNIKIFLSKINECLTFLCALIAVLIPLFVFDKYKQVLYQIDPMISQYWYTKSYRGRSVSDFKYITLSRSRIAFWCWCFIYINYYWQKPWEHNLECLSYGDWSGSFQCDIITSFSKLIKCQDWTECLMSFFITIFYFESHHRNTELL